MGKYELWSEVELRNEIVSLERNVARNVAAISNPTQGGITYGSLAEAKEILRDLYRAYYRVTGQIEKLRASGGFQVWSMGGVREF